MNIRKLLLVLFAIGLGCVPAQAQVVASGDLTDHIDTMIATMPSTYDGGDYLQPNEASRTLWLDIVEHILAGELSEAHDLAQTKNYQVVVYTDTESEDSAVHVLLERTPASTSRYWGTYVFNAAPARPHLVIQCPHPRYDSNTGYQGIRVYQHTGARAFFVSGTHRCNGTTYSPCDGTSSVCSGSSEPYRYSDMAHVTSSAFHVATEAMLDDDPGLLIVQPHGFAQGDDDPDLIISNGTRSSPSGTDYAVLISDALQDVDPTLTAKVAHIDLSWTRLIATTNTQGRLINGVAEPCGTYAYSSTGNFVHIEQARVGLRDTPANWMKLAQAIAAAVPEEASPVGDGLGMQVSPARLIGNYANPFYGRTRVAFELGRSGPIQLEVFDLRGRRITKLAGGAYESGVHTVEWKADGVAAGTYFIRLRQGGHIDTLRCILLR